jgi:hypothetical protein
MVTLQDLVQYLTLFITLSRFAQAGKILPLDVAK